MSFSLPSRAQSDRAAAGGAAPTLHDTGRCTLGGSRCRLGAWTAARGGRTDGRERAASNLHDGLLREDVVSSQYLGMCSCIFIRANHRKRKTEKEMEKSEPNMNICIKVNTSSVLN